jgi:heterodisulfide reductase subunit C
MSVMNKEDLSFKVRQFTDVNVVECYQCGKCTAGCPVAERMDLRPSVIMRMLQSGDAAAEEEILRSNSIWLCLTCETCYSRCPMELDIPKVIDYLRERSYAEGKVNPQSHNIVAFHKSFLNDVGRNGRLHEIGLIVEYKLKSRAFFQDITLAPEMYSRGKLHILPEKIKDRKGLTRLFKGQFIKRKS